ncbi:DUF47 family protein [Ruminococcaceae bacterium OttesenSCG-928-I18]|nr:DUF47 family protein [Ruminococcaceae bacterium OttesenSCG-928-I18]
MAKANFYFDTFNILVEKACTAAEELQDTLAHFSRENFKAEMKILHDIEHEADMVKHEMIKKLAREFVTPIDREDILQLANEIDDLVDTIEDVLIRMYMYNIRETRPEALQFTDVIVRCCQALRDATAELPNFHKSKTLHQAIVDVNTMEEEGDAIYIEGMHRLFREGGDAVNVVAWSEVFDRLEDCCDTCEHVANAMESIAMKNA